jgi:UDP-N-acetylmuramoyl-tripeptide--D-alanyl-D-alanine ligase
VFVALPGTRTDGHDYLEEVRKKGALLAVVTRPVPQSSLPQLLVSDPLLAIREMGRLALEAHREAGHRLVALTGSVGKTTTKELLRLALSPAGKTHGTRANENNEIGVPLTLLSWPADAPYCVLEAGVRKVGDMDYLAPLLRSDIGIVTAIGPGHLESLRTIEEVWAEKSKLLRCVVPGGTMVVPGPVKEMFPEDSDRLARGKNLVVATLREGGKESGPTVAWLDSSPSGFVLHMEEGRIRIPLSRPSRALAWCVLLAILAVRALGVDLSRAAERIAEYEGVAGRMERRVLSSGLLVLLDHYNANPESMREALAWFGRELALRPGGRGFAVLGDMLELGSESGHYHEKMGGQAAALPIETLWYKGNERPAFEAGFVGAGGDLRSIRPAESFSDDLASGLGPSGRDVLLVKASRGMKLEEIIKPLIGER